MLVILVWSFVVSSDFFVTRSALATAGCVNCVIITAGEPARVLFKKLLRSMSDTLLSESRFTVDS